MFVLARNMLNTSIHIALIEMSANENKNVFVGAVRTIPTVKFGKFAHKYCQLLFHWFHRRRLSFILIKSIIIWQILFVVISVSGTAIVLSNVRPDMYTQPFDQCHCAPYKLYTAPPSAILNLCLLFRPGICQ